METGAKECEEGKAEDEEGSVTEGRDRKRGRKRRGSVVSQREEGRKRERNKKSNEM